MSESMDAKLVEQALRLLGESLNISEGVEILLVGGAAGMITGVLSSNRVTTDCDVIKYLPDDAMAAVELAAEKVAEELELSPNWLNSDVHIRSDTLPKGWDERKQRVGKYGVLTVSAASRIDLIAMKVLAGRDQDIEDLIAMKLRQDDVEFVREYLKEVKVEGTNDDEVKEAIKLLNSMDVTDEE